MKLNVLCLKIDVNICHVLSFSIMYCFSSNSGVPSMPSANELQVPHVPVSSVRALGTYTQGEYIYGAKGLHGMIC